MPLLVLLAYYLKKAAFNLISFGVMVAINTGLFASLIVYFFSIAGLIMWIFLKINEMIELINNYNGDTILTLGFKIIQSSGIWSGLADAFIYISSGLLLVFLAFLSKLVIKALFNFRNSVLSLIIASK